MVENPGLITARIDLLEKFVSDLRIWLEHQPARFAARAGSPPNAEAREGAERSILRSKRAVAQAIRDAGVPTMLTLTPPASIGGPVQRADIVENVFGTYFQGAIGVHAIRAAEEAIGVY